MCAVLYIQILSGLRRCGLLPQLLAHMEFSLSLYVRRGWLESVTMNCDLLDVRHSLVIICMMLVAILMAPITWYLWIYTGSANANFYFAMTMVFNVAQVGRDAVIERHWHEHFLDVSYLGFALRVLETAVLSEKWPDGSAVQRRRRPIGISLASVTDEVL